MPHAGTWIEIVIDRTLLGGYRVVPHAGTWIEIASKRAGEPGGSRASRRHVD